ncbi:MAG: lipoprotein [Herbaspirillum sp.]|jgi:LPS-assembly lipoprotein|nr:lipoprotein [Herbaspirillum sp.]
MRQYRETFTKWLFMLSIAVALSACGFQLRGKPNLPFKSVYLNVGPTSPVGVELKRYLKAAGIDVVDRKENAEAIFQLLSEARDKKILTLNSQGQISEYILYQRSSFTVTDAKGRPLLPPTEIVLKRDVSYNPNQELAQAAEEVLMYKDMQSDLVQQIMRRMSAITTMTPAVPVNGAP